MTVGGTKKHVFFAFFGHKGVQRSLSRVAGNKLRKVTGSYSTLNTTMSCFMNMIDSYLLKAGVSFCVYKNSCQVSDVYVPCALVAPAGQVTQLHK